MTLDARSDICKSVAFKVNGHYAPNPANLALQECLSQHGMSTRRTVLNVSSFSSSLLIRNTLNPFGGRYKWAIADAGEHAQHAHLYT